MATPVASPRDVQLTATAPDSSQAAPKNALWPFIIITITYLLFTVTDGAVRMLVLLHAYTKGFTAMEVSVMFALYELCGAGTNLAAGVVGAKWGIRVTLIAGLLMQIVGLSALYAWNDKWSKLDAIVYVTFAQALCGVAKDLVKLGGKTVTKLITPEEKQEQLFRLVSGLTGYKNSLKGVGYFLGAALLDVSYELAIHVNVALIVVALPFAFFGLTTELGKVASQNVSLESVFKQKPNINWLSLARLFLFGSRDLWFEVPLPFYLRAADGLNWPRTAVGAVLAGYIILYGQVQSFAPNLVLMPLKQSPPNKFVCVLWNLLLAAVPLVLGVGIWAVSREHEGSSNTDNTHTHKVIILSFGVVLFAFIFAINSAVHSYLIVRYADGNKVAMNVGFYYMANAFGRLFGTILSGALYSYVSNDVDVSLSVCFFVSVLFVCLSAAAAWYIEDDEGGLRWGKNVSCLGAEPWRVVDATSKLDQASVRGEEGLGKTEEVPLRK
mmetsp:Transcript_4494/g.14984  ORF Transcript_4494/g.14984 Transcript_4494/m.14984 type:complete len:496 (+) Transcript_4494:212-1699(+)|eukprot:CAMPEP_0119216432 /NCGR_PEP_ID=MMETSP1327-20130426/15263_1 /TAXON_ID=38833 /ORGANISM="Micromonas pusilla, Strain RCC2306" /LENGTH=495 /DNA_ID=CAMNT_0007214341 /DNA_START=152 /DNA_END=1639 /DNA_ORIENTATION=-